MSDFPSGERTIAFVFLKSIIIVVTVSLGIPYANNICSIFYLCMESNSSEKFINCSVVSRFFAFILSMIQWVVRICEDVE